MALVNNRREKVNEQCYNLLRKFNLREFKENVLTLFEELSWELVSKAIRKYNLSTNMEDISKLCVEYAKGFSMDKMRQIYGHLLLHDVVLHSIRKNWTAVSMRNENSIPFNDDIARSIKSSFRENSKNINIYWHTVDDINWFVIIVNRRTTRSDIIYHLPIFIAHPVDSTFLFVAPKNAKIDSLKIITSGFGYDNFKLLKLQGRNIMSLMSMLIKKQNADAVRAEISRALRVNNNTPIRTAKGVNFCKNKQRQRHAEALFGNESVELQTLTVNVKTEWRGVRTLPQAAGSSFNMTVRFKSKNVCESLACLVKEGIIKEPYPIWAQEFLVAGKNVINIA